LLACTTGARAAGADSRLDASMRAPAGTVVLGDCDAFEDWIRMPLGALRSSNQLSALYPESA